MSKKLVAYFSCGGETERVAKKLAKAVDADVFEIKPKVPYTEADLDWNNKDSRSSVEMRKLIRPEIADRVENMPAYDTVFVGFPIWWYLAPTIINGFFESYDFSGKTVVTFATSGSGEMGKADAVLRSLLPADVDWKPGRTVNGLSQDELAEWVHGLGIE